MRKFYGACSLALLLVAVAGPASARAIRIDFGNNFEFNGSSWPDSTANDDVNVENDETFEGSLGAHVPLTFGGTTFTDFCLSENGFFTLSATSGCGGIDDLAIQVLGNDWVSDASVSAILEGSVSFSTGGRIDRVSTVAPYSDAQAQDAIRFLWNNLLLSPSVGGDGIARSAFQALFFERSDGGFDLELNYGLIGDPGPFLGVQSISYGGTTLFDGAPPILQANNYVFSFVGDTFTVGGSTPPPPPTSVPEPQTLSLLLAGLALAALRRRRAR